MTEAIKYFVTSVTTKGKGLAPQISRIFCNRASFKTMILEHDLGVDLPRTYLRGPGFL